MPEQPDHAEVIDLTSPRPADGEVLRVEAESPFERLSEKERVRLIVRVLCELVAYDEVVEHDDASGASLTA